MAQELFGILKVLSVESICAQVLSMHSKEIIQKESHTIKRILRNTI